MATDVPQRELRNNTAELLRRVERGERLRITVHGHPVAELVPLEHPQVFVAFEEVARELNGLLGADDRLERELRKLGDEPRDPFA
jgi:prevent-host-death family protein